MTGLRGAAFAQTVDRIGGVDGVEALTEEGAHAHRLSAELQELARTNTAASQRVAARVDRRDRGMAAALILVAALGLAWIAGNVVGYVASEPRALAVSGEMGRRAVALPDGSTAAVDCWTSGGVERVWESAPPFGWLVPYRCGEGAAAAAMPGVLTAAMAFVALVALFLLRMAWRRRQRRLAWY